MRETLGIFRYEYLMQIRRPGLWISLIITAGLFLFFDVRDVHAFKEEFLQHAGELGGSFILQLNLLPPVAAGILAADRFPRDRLLNMNELLNSSLQSRLSLVVGKYLGSLLAVLTPTLLLTLLAVVALVVDLRQVAFLPLLLLALPVILAPSWLFAVAWCLVFPLVMPLRLYQVLYAGFWMWAVAVPYTRLPTINQSFLSVHGDYALRAFFTGEAGNSFLRPPATPGWAVINISIVLGLTAVALVALWVMLRRQEVAR